MSQVKNGLTAALLLLSALAARPAWGEVPACANPAIHFTEDYAYLIGSADLVVPDPFEELGGAYRFLVNGEPLFSGSVDERMLLHFDDSLVGTGGETPLYAAGYGFAPGKRGSAVTFEPYGGLRFGRTGNLSLAEGSVEMWVATRASGDDPAYVGQHHYLFHYRTPSQDAIAIAHAADTGVLYAGGSVDDEWQSAYGAEACTRAWTAGEWHHLAYTYSATGNFMRFYVDGKLVADSNEGSYRPPAQDSDYFVIGGDVWGRGAHYAIDEVRLSARAVSADVIAARARRREPARANEVWLATDSLPVDAQVVFEFTPSSGSQTGEPCASEPVLYPGIPLTDPTPPTTLLPPVTTSLPLSLRSVTPTVCRYSIGTPLPFEQMSVFDSLEPSAEHEGIIRGIDPDSNTVSDVYLRCAAYPDYVLHVRYRCLAPANPSYPRTGNLWGSWQMSEKGLEHCSRIDLWLGAQFTPDEIRELRLLNPHTQVLTAINAVEHPGLPDRFYLRDIYGNRVEVWPGSYRLNVTKPEVAENQARLAYQQILDSDLMFDGCFFDNVMTTQSWQTHDIYGNPFLIDADENGVVDDPDAFDAAWKAGVFHELETFRALMPHAIVNGHTMDIQEPGIAEVFNGISLGFLTADVLEDKYHFLDLWEFYAAWQSAARRPTATMLESTPPDQIAYGYGYTPRDTVPASTLEFARTYYPSMRFGLALTLMFDGYFAHEFGDTWHGNDWWYDELDFDLGCPLGPATRVTLNADALANGVENGSFEDGSSPAPLDPWQLWVDVGAGYRAAVSLDTTDAAEGEASARIDVLATNGDCWLVDFGQYDRAFTEGVAYDVAFWAKSDRVRNITLSAQKGSPDWDNYGLWRSVELGTQWREYTVSFEANATTNDSRLQFMMGETIGAVWLDDVRLYARRAEVFRRDFTNGLVLLNPTRSPQTIPLGEGFRRLTGDQAPRHEYILDDSDAAFEATGSWSAVTYDSGEWQALGPFYHDWGEGCRQSSKATDEACYTLDIPQSDTYTITAWWPAAPTAWKWSASVRYEIGANGQVIDLTTLDQRSGGDEWHAVATVHLDPDDGAFVRIRGLDGAPCIADALHVRSSARYNDGLPASSVTLQPRDGIVLARNSAQNPTGDVNGDGVVNASDIQLVVNAALGVSPGPNADLNGDDSVDAIDVQLVVNVALGHLA